MLKKQYIFIFALLLFVSMSCKKNYTPKPGGYFRIDLPTKQYQLSNGDYPFSFEYPTYTRLVPDTTIFAEPYWVNINFPTLNSNIHVSYKSIENNLTELTEESRELVYKHAIKATGITDSIYLNDEKNVYGTIYQIRGNVASTFQFHLTDSLHHFVRGSFYVSAIPNYDSLSPVLKFIDEDIYHLIETFSWRNNATNIK